LFDLAAAVKEHEMPRIKLAWILPAVMVALTAVSFELARHTKPPIRGNIYWHPTHELILAGLNTPADRLDFVLFGLLRWPSWMGVRSGDLLYFVLVGVLWFLVGKNIDSYRFGVESPPEVVSSRRNVWDFVMFLYGLYLVLVICLNNVIFTSPARGNGGTANFVGDLIRQGLWLLWSLALIVFPGRALVRAARRGRIALDS
jgi:hypothetical protein